MTCRDCKGYEECKKQQKLAFEILDDGFFDGPQLCTYVDIVCSGFDAKGGQNG